MKLSKVKNIFLKQFTIFYLSIMINLICNSLTLFSQENEGLSNYTQIQSNALSQVKENTLAFIDDEDDEFEKMFKDTILPTDTIKIADYMPRDKRNLYRYGITGNSTFNLHNSSFSELDPTLYPNCCSEFKSGYGLGVNLGIFYSHFITEIISFEYSANLSYYDATLRETEIKQIEIDKSITNAEILHQLESSLRYAEFNFKIKLDFINNSRIYAGLFASTPIVSSFSQFERLEKPENRGTFENGLRIRNQYSGDIPNINKLFYGFLVGIEYDFYLNKKKSYAMTPQVTIGQSFNSLISTNNWLVSFLRFGFAFSYNSYNEFDSPLAPTN